MKKERVMNNVFLLLAFVGLISQTYAQDNNVNVTVEGVKEIQVESSEKISENPSFTDSVKINSNLKYSMMERKAPSVFKPKPINAPKLGNDKNSVPKLYNGLIKLGVIDFTTLPFAEVSYGSKYSKTETYTATFRHYASDLKTKAISPARLTETSIQASGKKFLKTHTVLGDLDYNYNTHRYYGSMYTEDQVSLNVLKQQYSKGHIKIGALSNYKKEDELHHKINFDFYNLFDAFNMVENRAVLSGSVSPTVMGNKGNIDASIDWFNYTNNAVSAASSLLVQASPSVLFKKEKYNLKGGLNIYVLAETNSAFHIYPFVEAEYILIKDVFVAYAKYQGYFERYDYLRHVESNPFINTSMPLTNTSHLNNTFAGLRGNISSKLSFNLGAEVDQIKNMPLYVNEMPTFFVDPFVSYNGLFTVITDDAVLLRTFGQFSWDMQKIKLSAKGNYRKYTMQIQQEAWHTPIWDAGLSGKYNFQDLLFINLDLFYNHTQFAAMNSGTFGTTIDVIPGFLDVNFGLEYKYSKRLSAFLNANNLLNKQYRRWNQYPNYGINFFGGITYAF